MEEKIKEAFDEFMYNFLDIILAEYHDTDTYKLREEKISQMYAVCEGEFTKSQQSFIQECFDLLLKEACGEMNYVFNKAFFSGISLIKQLGVL